MPAKTRQPDAPEPSDGSTRARARLGRARAGALAAAAALLATTAGQPAAHASPDREGVWEQGEVTSVADGDTLNANLHNGSGPLGRFRIRTIGVQAPEIAHSGKIAECGSAQATDRLRSTFPVGAAIQTRSVFPESRDDYTNGRLVRSLYAQDAEGNWYDSSRQTMRDGWMMWLPLAADNPTKPEWAHNLEYRVLADKAAAERRGLWAADLCGPSPARDARLRVWAKYYGTEQVFVENTGHAPVDLSGWTIRDSAANGYRTLPAGTVVAPGEVREVFTGQMNLNNLPASNDEFEGDALYLLDNAGPYSTGNLRAWFPYPCNPDECTDPLSGRLSLSRIQAEDPPEHAPSAPGSLTARASADGSGEVLLGWAAPNDLGGRAVTYTIVSRTPGSDDVRTTGVTGTSHTVTGLRPGAAYTFEVRAANAAGESAGARTTRAVTPTGPAPSSRTSEGPGSTAAPSAASGSTPAPGAAAGSAATPEPATESAASPQVDPTSTAGAGASADSSSTDPAGGHLDAPASAAPPAVASPWAAGEFVDITNTSGAPVRLGGYGLWNTASSNFNNNGDREDRAAYLFPADASLAAGQTLRVHSGTRPEQPSDAAGVHQQLWTDLPEFIGASNDYVELAHLSRAQVDCRATSGGTCRGTKQQSVSTPPVGVTARTTPSEVTVSWGAPISRGGTAITGYTATAYDAAIGGHPIASCSTGGSARSCSFPASIGRAYHVEVVARNALGDSGGSWRVLAAPRTAPSVPAFAHATGAPGGVAVSWGPAAANGAAITRYTASAYLSASGGSAVASCTASGDELGCVIPGLRHGTPYFVSVTATNRAGTSPATARVAASPSGRPAAVTSYAGRKVTVRWDAPAAGSSVTTGYTATVHAAPTGGAVIGRCSAPAGRTSCTTGKLPKRSRYYVSLTQHTRAGDFTTAPRIETGPARTASAPTAVHAAARPGAARVAISWQPPASSGFSPLKGYQARLYSKARGGSVKSTCTTGADGRSCTTASVRRGTYYAATRVRNGKGWSRWSGRVRVVVP